MTADVVTDKTKALGWSPKRKLADYIENIKNK
jgi:UDP-glucose 4-epimerase